MSSNTTQKTPQVTASEFFWQGLGFWNVYFILKFALGHFGYLNLQPLNNALLLLFVLLPIRNRWFNTLRQILAAALALVLVYSESWLPGLESLMTNAGNIAGFSSNYMFELAWDFLNFKMIGWGLLVVLAYLLLKNYIRISAFTVGYFLFFAVQPYFDVNESELVAGEIPEVALNSSAVSAVGTGNASLADSETVEKWYEAFLNYEKDRRATLPQGIAEKDTPFDIVFLNICSLSNDDLEVSELAAHSVFKQFNLRFDHFSSATSYSGPATLRLLNAACGQPAHNGLYDGRRPECEIMNRLDRLGFKQHLFMDHSGKYDDYLETLRNKAGLTAPLETPRSATVKYMAFNDEPIADDLAILRYWQRSMAREKATRNVTLFNFMALHDGNRLPRHSRWQPFKPRAKIFLDDLQTFMKELEKSGRKVMLIVVPEHGAAVRGDKIQAARLRDIPSPRITEVPAMVKFFGLKNLPKKQIHITDNTSYLALSSLIGKTLETNFFSADTGAVPLEELVKDLPQTNPVAENGQSIVLNYKGQDYIRQNGGKWQAYTR